MMDTMTPQERQDQQIDLVKDQLADLLSNVYLVRWLGVDEQVERELDFVDKAQKVVAENLNCDDLIRALMLSVWDEAYQRALATMKQIPKERA